MSTSTADDTLPEYALDYGKSRPNRFADQAANLVELDAQVASYLRSRAAVKGVALGELVNDMLHRDIELIESVK